MKGCRERGSGSWYCFFIRFPTLSRTSNTAFERQHQSLCPSRSPACLSVCPPRSLSCSLAKSQKKPDPPSNIIFSFITIANTYINASLSAKVANVKKRNAAGHGVEISATESEKRRAGRKTALCLAGQVPPTMCKTRYIYTFYTLWRQTRPFQLFPLLNLHTPVFPSLKSNYSD